MTLIDKTKNYLNVEKNNFYTFKHFNFEDVKEAVIEFKKLIYKKQTRCEKCKEISRAYDTLCYCEKHKHQEQLTNSVLLTKFNEIFGDFEK
jgi:hypothetical protein